MNLPLFPHNQTAYMAVQSLLEQKGKAAVIHPTGTGKSLIAFQLVADHPEAEILWLAPSEYIFQTQMENLKKISPEVWERARKITFLTYAKLMMHAGQKHTLHPDYIILDEFHRCGAAEWGKSVRQLLSDSPQAKLLGLSATNIRYLDGQRDMAAELFDGAVASEMTLGEAVVKQILPAPKYVVSLYSYQEELRKLQIKIEHLKQPAAREKNQKLLEELRRALEHAEGLPQVFAKHMKPAGGKYIVFCSGKEHMEEMMSHVREWFSLVDKHPHVYAVFYDNPNTSRAFQAFKADNGSRLCLLFCIDMLNEGIHVENIDGVVLLRPTVSPIIYLQQIGRSLSAGRKGQTPVIFDIVNNFDSLYTMDFLEKEMEEAFLLYGGDGIHSRFSEQFQIFDEIKDCRRLFLEINRSLCADWETYYHAAADYYKTQGHLRIPKSYVTPEGLSLGLWLQTQRRVKNGKIPGRLSKMQIEKLDALGMEWECGTDRSWNRGYQALQKYKETHGSVDVHVKYVDESGFALGKWVSNLRSKWKRGEYEVLETDGSRQAKAPETDKKLLTIEQIEALDALGMIWDKHTSRWEQNYHAAKEYFSTYGNLRVPHDYRTENGMGLGVWIANQRSIFYGKKRGAAPLSSRQIERLNEIEMVWKQELDKKC